MLIRPKEIYSYPSRGHPGDNTKRVSYREMHNFKELQSKPVVLKAGEGAIVKKLNTQADCLGEYYGAVFHSDNDQFFPTLPIPVLKICIPVVSPCLVFRQFSTLDILVSWS